MTAKNESRLKDFPGLSAVSDLDDSSQEESPTNWPSLTFTEDGQEDWGVRDARPLLPKAAFFMGDLRDGLSMLNMQAAFLISAKKFTEKQVGILFLVFGLSQFLSMAPSGYFLDYSNNKISWVMFSGATTSALTILTALTVAPYGENFALMMVLKFLQGGVTAILPPGFNGITLGIVGSTGFTHQVSRNRMMNHMGTAFIVAIGTLISYFSYPNIGHLFIVSPLAAVGFCYNLSKIRPQHVHRDAARGLIISSPTMTEYELMDEEAEFLKYATSLEEHENRDKLAELPFKEGSYVPPDLLRSSSAGLTRSRSITRSDDKLHKTTAPTKIDTLPSPTVEAGHVAGDTPSKESTNTANTRGFSSMPSFNFGWGVKTPGSQGSMHSIQSPQGLRAQTPLSVLIDPTLMVFTLVVFFFHLANSAVLPLAMQSLKVKDAQTGLLLSGMCIIIGQAFMAFFAKFTGDYSPFWGRKKLCLIALASLTIRCFLLVVLNLAQDQVRTWTGLVTYKFLILSTQCLDSVGAGIFGTLHIVVTNDISGGTGRFSLMMGITSSAMCLGCTVSGYLGHTIAQDYGYPAAFGFLGIMSVIPFLLCLFFVPETLPDYVKPKTKRRRRLEAVLQRLDAQQRGFNNIVQRNPDDEHQPDERTDKNPDQMKERREHEFELL